MISINGFLSTTRNLDIAKTYFAGANQYRHEYCFDEENIIRAYADISEISEFPHEEEVLYSVLDRFGVLI